MKKTKLEKILIIPDCHHPFVDKKAWNLMLKTAKALKPDHVVILGDFGDFFSTSSHAKNPNLALKLEEEVVAVKKALDEVIALGAKNNVFIEGNHEDRLKRFLEDKAPELYNFISIPKILELKEKGFKHILYKQSYKLGKMNFTHDVGTAGRYAHYKALDTYQHNIVTGHTHRFGFAIEGNAQGERHVTMMSGWLGDVDSIDYLHRVKAKKDWSLGFSIGFLDTSTQVVYLVPIPIINGTCMLNGELFTL
jgi:predicted phosphodiesterase